MRKDQEKHYEMKIEFVMEKNKNMRCLRNKLGKKK